MIILAGFTTGWCWEFYSSCYTHTLLLSYHIFPYFLWELFCFLFVWGEGKGGKKGEGEGETKEGRKEGKGGRMCFWIQRNTLCCVVIGAAGRFPLPGSQPPG